MFFPLIVKPSSHGRNCNLLQETFIFEVKDTHKTHLYNSNLVAFLGHNKANNVRYRLKTDNFISYDGIMYFII